MNAFNKLYNLILQSIITEDIESKIRKAIQTLIKSGQLKDQNDPRAEQVKTIIKRNNSIDINGKTKLDQLLKTNQEYINRSQAKKSQYLDNIPQFSQKKEYPNGVVIYRVEQSKAAQAAVRKVIDAQWGKDANPWCLASRKGDGLDKNYSHWKNYSAYPKHIAFQNGKLLAFCADNSGNCTWWDRQDHPHKKLPLLDDSQMETEQYQWTEEQLADLWLKKKGLVFNQQTQRYDSESDVSLNSDDLKNGKIPLPLGVINGDFNIHYNTLITLDQPNSPTLIKGMLDVSYNNNLHSLGDMVNRTQGGIKYIGCSKLKFNPSKEWIKENWIKINKLVFNEETKRYDCNGWLPIYEENLVNGKFPIPLGVVNGNFVCDNCSSLTSLQNGPTQVKGDCDLYKNPNLTSLIGAPKIVGGDFKCRDDIQLISLEGAPEIVGKDFSCSRCVKLKNLKGAPKKVKSFYCNECTGLQSLEGAPEIVDGTFECSQCTSLISLKGVPKKVKCSFKAQGCRKLKDVSALRNMQAKKVILPPKFKDALGDPFKNQFVLNESTGMYDAPGAVKITKDNLAAKTVKDRYGDEVPERYFPFPIGTIKGSLDMRGSFLGNWKNSPRRIEKNFQLTKTRVKDMVGSPEYIGGKFTWQVDYPWEGPSSLQGAPKYIKQFVLSVNDLKSLKGLQNTKIDILNLWCRDLTSLQGLSQQHFKHIGIHHNHNIKSLLGISDDVDVLQLSMLDSLQNLDYLPHNLKTLDVFYCKHIKLSTLRKLKQERPNLQIKYNGGDSREQL